MNRDNRRGKRIGIFTTVYTVAAAAALVLIASLIVTLLAFNRVLQPEFTNYGDGTVSGWATIFSLIGFLGGLFGKVLIGLLVIFLAMAAVYCVVGLILNLFLRRKAAAGEPVKGVGTALGIWTMIPGALSLYELIYSLMHRAAELADVLRDGLFAALFLGGSLFLLVTLYGKEE